MENRRKEGSGYTKRANIDELKTVFQKYASVEENGEKFLTYKDFGIKFLNLLPEENYNEGTLSLYAGVPDQTKDGKISFSEFAAFERHLCNPDALYRTAFQVFDRDGEGSVSFSEFVSIMKRTTLHTAIPFDLEGSFVQLFFGKNHQRQVPYREFSQFLHDYHKRYSKYAFKAFDHDGRGLISTKDFCTMVFAIKSHLLTERVKTVLKEFVEKTEGNELNYAYCNAFQSILSDMETVKKVYLHASDGSKIKEISKEQFTFSSKMMSQVTPLEIEILFSLSKWIHESPTLIYSDLQSIAPEQYMKKVTNRLIDIKMVESPDERNGFIEFLEFVYRFSIGSLSGVLGASSVYPVDLIKTRMMNQRTRTDGVTMKNTYNDTMDCFRKVLKYEGIEGLYKGIYLQLLYVATGKATKLATNDYVRDKIATVNHGHLPLLGEVFAGGIAGMSNVLFSNPLEIIKIRLQCAGQYSTMSAPTASQVYKELGFRNIFKGITACILRDVPFSMIYFPAYAHLKSYLADDTGYNSPSSIFLSGAIAGAPAAFLVTPMDMIKTRIQVVRRPGQTSYNGIFDAAGKIYSEEGIKAFWKGGIARKLRTSPQFGITLVTYELIQRILFVDFGGSNPSGSFRETSAGSANLSKSTNLDHIGGYAIARPIFAGMESKFGLAFPRFQHQKV